jgi:hypothetical protein
VAAAVRVHPHGFSAEPLRDPIAHRLVYQTAQRVGCRESRLPTSSSSAAEITDGPPLHRIGTRPAILQLALSRSAGAQDAPFGHALRRARRMLCLGTRAWTWRDAGPSQEQGSVELGGLPATRSTQVSHAEP